MSNQQAMRDEAQECLVRADEEIKESRIAHTDGYALAAATRANARATMAVALAALADAEPDVAAIGTFDLLGDDDDEAAR